MGAVFSTCSKRKDDTDATQPDTSGEGDAPKDASQWLLGGEGGSSEQAAPQEEAATRAADVEIAPQAAEWNELEDSDEEDDVGRHASETFKARERRLTLGEEALRLEKTIGDADVEVVEQSKEWGGYEDSEDEQEDAPPLDDHAAKTYQAREKRLSYAAVALENETKLGDVDVEVLTEKTEWAGMEDSEDEREGPQAEDHATEVFARRERRLTQGAEMLKLEGAIGDADVQVVAQSTEWVGLEDDDSDDSDDEDGPEEVDTKLQEICQARERRVTRGEEVLKQELQLGDADVEVVTQATEWAGLGGSDGDNSDKENDDENIDRHLQEICQARVRRLTVGEEALKKDLQIGDADVEVVVQTTEWAGHEDSDGEDAAQEPDRHAAEAFSVRERRLTLGEEALKQEMPIGDAEVQVHTQAGEWAGHEDSDEEDDAQQQDRHAAETFSVRERRLTFSEEVLKQEIVIGDAEVEVHPQDAEWADNSDSSDEDEEAERQLEAHATGAYEAREKRLTLGAENAQQIVASGGEGAGDAAKEEGAAGAPAKDANAEDPAGGAGKEE